MPSPKVGNAQIAPRQIPTATASPDQATNRNSAPAISLTVLRTSSSLVTFAATRPASR
jgi:hypothetical protein